MVETATAAEQIEQCAVVFAVVVAVASSRADVVLLRRVFHLFESGERERKEGVSGGYTGQVPVREA